MALHVAAGVGCRIVAPRRFNQPQGLGVIVLWATWCILSGKVRDGLVGKIIYAVIALNGYAILARSERMFFSPTIASDADVQLAL